MEKKLFDPATITVDGRMDEPQWAEVAEQTGFYLLKRQFRVRKKSGRKN